MKYAFVEIITTGLDFKRDRIVHISSTIVENYKIINHFSTYLNPRLSVQSEWKLATGISDHNLATAPYFYNVAKNFLELWDQCILISSNPRLTYTFIKNEFESLGYPFTQRFKNLDEFIEIDKSKLEKGISKIDGYLPLFLNNSLGNDPKSVKKSILPQDFSELALKAVPNTCGVYFLKNHDGDIIYIGKALKLKNRIRQHFRSLTKKGFKVYKQVQKIDFTETPSELGALLYEAYMIGIHKPSLNKALRNKIFNYELRMDISQQGVVCVYFGPIGKNNYGKTVKRYRSNKGMKNVLIELITTDFLHKDYTYIHNCKVNHDAEQIDDVDEYNLMVKSWLKSINPFYNHTYSISQYDNSSEEIIVKNGIFNSFTIGHLNDQSERIYYATQNELMLNILISYMKKNSLQVSKIEPSTH